MVERPASMLAYRACLILIQLKCRLEFGSRPQRSYSRIGSPAVLHDERVCFKDKLRRYTALNAEHRRVLFQPVGWEDSVGGAGRPQALINEDLKQCDYAVFVFHDRYGSPQALVIRRGLRKSEHLRKS